MNLGDVQTRLAGCPDQAATGQACNGRRIDTARGCYRNVAKRLSNSHLDAALIEPMMQWARQVYEAT